MNKRRDLSRGETGKTVPAPRAVTAEDLAEFKRRILRDFEDATTAAIEKEFPPCSRR